MYCHNCGAQIPDGAKFCTECGERIERVANRSISTYNDNPLGGTLTVTRQSCGWNDSVPVEIWIDNTCGNIVRDGETITIDLSAGEYCVTLKQQGRDISSRLIEIHDGANEMISFAVPYPKKPSTYNRGGSAPLSRSAPAANSYYQPPVQVTQQVVVHNTTNGREKNKWIAFLLCVFLGYLGFHKFYEGRIGQGILYLFTLGLFGIGWVIDAIILLCKPNPYYV